MYATSTLYATRPVLTYAALQAPPACPSEEGSYLRLRLLYHSTLGSIVIKKKKQKGTARSLPRRAYLPDDYYYARIRYHCAHLNTYYAMGVPLQEGRY